MKKNALPASCKAAACVAGLLLATLLLWSLTAAFRLEVLMNAANRALAASGDERRLAAPLPRAMQPPGVHGGIFSLAGSASSFAVFTVMRDGIPVPHGAELTPDGLVAEVVPLGNHAAQVSAVIPQAVIRAHFRRVESAVSGGGGE